jgi:TPR repeat protein
MYARGCLHKDGSAVACNALADAFAYAIGRMFSEDSALTYFQRGCNRGHATACARTISRIDRRRSPGPGALAIQMQNSQKACRDGSPLGCLNLGVEVEQELNRMSPQTLGLREFKQRGVTVVDSYRQGCQKRIPLACNNLAKKYQVAQFVGEARLDSAFHYFHLACTGRVWRGGFPLRSSGLSAVVDSAWQHAQGQALACGDLADLLLSGKLQSDSPATDSIQAVAFLKTGCDLYDPAACTSLALLPGSLTNFSDQERVRILDRTCFEGNHNACNEAGRWRVTQSEELQAQPFFVLACQLNSEYGCFNLARQQSEYASRMKYFRRACQLEHRWSCAAIADELLGNDLEARRGQAHYYAKACELGDASSCGKVIWSSIYSRHVDAARRGQLLSTWCALEKKGCKRKWSES